MPGRVALHLRARPAPLDPPWRRQGQPILHPGPTSSGQHLFLGPVGLGRTDDALAVLHRGVGVREAGAA